MNKSIMRLSLILISFFGFALGVVGETKNATYDYVPYEGSIIYNTNINWVKVNNNVADYDADTSTFSIDVAHNFTEINNTNVEVSQEDPLATVSEISSTNLNPGLNTINITVTAQDGTIKTYYLKITKLLDTDADLESFSLNSGGGYFSGIF